MAAVKRAHKAAIVTVQDAETKLPINEASFGLLGEGDNFRAEPNGSLPGQFVVVFDSAEGAAILLRTEAPGYAPKELRFDRREPARYEVELERLPIQFIL